MSSSPDTPEMKAGHPPAVKAGGMRIARPRHTSTGESKEAPPASAPEEEQPYSSTPPKSEKHSQRMLISGAVTSGDKDFTPDAVKQYHDKPLPTKEKRAPPQSTHNIKQPK